MKSVKYVVGVRSPIAAKMTKPEKKDLAGWVSCGKSLLDNPWYISNERGHPMGYISAMLIIFTQMEEMGINVEDDLANVTDSSEIDLPF
jgi:hypothetical protein